MTPFLGVAGLGGAGSLIGANLSGDSYFVATLNSSNDERGTGVTVGSDGSIYVCGGGSGDVYKYNSSGVLQWQRYWDVGGSWQKIAIDSSDNVYVTKRYNQNTSVLVKYNSSGVYQWNVTLYNNNGNHFFQPQDVSIDSNDNIYVAGYVLDLSGSPSLYKALVIKYNTAGQLDWYRIYNASGYNSMDCYGCTSDSSGNVYITGQANSSSGNRDRPYVAKINSSGTPQWCAGVILPLNQSSGSTSIGFDVAVDNVGNAYLAGHGNQNTGNGPDNLLIKFNNAGGVMWQNFAGYSSNSDELKGVATDSSGNIYSVGLMNQLGNNYPTATIFKHNSSGTLQFVRTLINSNAAYSGVYTYITAENIEIDSDDNLYITGLTNKSTQDTSSPSDEVVVAKLPSDGSLTGTYGSFTYADASSYAHSNNINTLGVASYSLIDNSATYSPSTGTLSRTEGATSLTSATTLFE